MGMFIFSGALHFDRRPSSMNNAFGKVHLCESSKRCINDNAPHGQLWLCPHILAQVRLH